MSNNENKFTEERDWILSHPRQSTLKLMQDFANHKAKQILTDFEKLVFESRKAQKNFYASKQGTETKRHYLQKSKLLESQIDTYFENKRSPKLEL